MQSVESLKNALLRGWNMFLIRHVSGETPGCWRFNHLPFKCTLMGLETAASWRGEICQRVMWSKCHPEPVEMFELCWRKKQIIFTQAGVGACVKTAVAPAPVLSSWKPHASLQFFLFFQLQLQVCGVSLNLGEWVVETNWQLHVWTLTKNHSSLCDHHCTINLFVFL